MRRFTLTALCLLLADLAIPSNASPVDLIWSIQSKLRNSVQRFMGDAAARPVITGQGQAVVDGITPWSDAEGRQFITKDGIIYESVSYPEYPQHSLRIKSPTLCDPNVLQYSGYLDINGGAHSLFFWFFESRNKPSSDPLLLWLNGGPGCSSSTGLLFELGPCSISDEGRNTTFNKFSWNTQANVIFLDQPVAVGYSYSSDGSSVSTSPVAALDVWAFLELFLTRFPKYSKLDFHLAAESYGGTYAPNIASVIHKKNKELGHSSSPNIAKINLSSVILANGLTDPLVQFGKVAEYACEGPYPVFSPPDSPECQALRSKTPTCQRLIQACYDYNSRFACVPAALYCWSQLYGSFQGKDTAGRHVEVTDGPQELGLNPYDVRKKCDRERDGQLCYKQMGWIETFMNDPSVKLELGVSSAATFQSCNLEVNQAFMSQGDAMHNSALLLSDLLADGVRLLVYAGNADFMCSFIGNEAWMESLESKYKPEFTALEGFTWAVAGQKRPAGRVRSAGGGNYTFIEVFEAGHMVPYDQPEAAVDMIAHWVQNEPLAHL